MSLSNISAWLRRVAKKIFFDQHLHMSGAGHALVLGVAIVIGVVGYGCVLESAHDSVRSSIKETDSLCAILQRAPELLGPVDGEGHGELGSRCSRAVPWADSMPLDELDGVVSASGEDAVLAATSAVAEAADASKATGTPMGDSLAPPLPKGDSTDVLAQRRMVAWLQGLGIAGPEDASLDITQMEQSEWRIVLKAFADDPQLSEYLRQGVATYAARPTPDLIVRIAYSMARVLQADASEDGASEPESVSATNCLASNASLLTDHSDALAAALGGEPRYGFNFVSTRGVAADYVDVAAGLTQARDNAPTCDVALKQILSKQIWKPRFALMVRGAARVPDGAVLQALAAAMGIAVDNGWTGMNEAVAPPEDRVRQQRNAIRFLLALMSEVRASAEVRTAQSWVTFWRGGEQLAMLIIAAWVALLLCARVVGLRTATLHAEKIETALGGVAPGKPKASLDAITNAITGEDSFVTQLATNVVNYYRRTRAQEELERHARVEGVRALFESSGDELYNSTWAIRLGTALLPSIGFLGTVLGIMSALANVDAITRLPPGPLQAVEVSFVATALGLAFATTAVALLAGMLLKVASDILAAKEAVVLTSLETKLLTTFGEMTTASG